MNKIKTISVFTAFVVAFSLIVSPLKTAAAGGIYASGGGSKSVGQTFYVNVTASGATFNALEGTISVSGPVSVVSFSAGNATWMVAPSNGTHFVGMLTSPASSLKIATIGLKGNSIGSGAVSVSSVQLANAGSIVGTGASGTSFTISRAPTPPGAIGVTSSSHPDQETQYEETTVVLNWSKPNGVTEMVWAWDNIPDTTPNTATTETTMTFTDQAVGTYYFHLRAKNTDGWGAITHFKVQIKEPDPKVDDSLDPPSNIKIEKSDNFKNDIETGMITGLVISGQTEKLFLANIILSPEPSVPEDYLKNLALEEKTNQISLNDQQQNPEDNNESVATDKEEIDTSKIKPYTTKTDGDGKFSLTLDFPIPAGHYQLIVQGQKEKVLTPESEKIIFEISQKEGGKINILSADDEKEPNISPIVKGTFLQNEYTVIEFIFVAVALLLVIVAVFLLKKFLAKRRNKYINN